MSWSQFSPIVCGLRFCSIFTLSRSEVMVLVVYGKKPKVLPKVTIALK
jgi:hypothetical protein